MMSSSNITLCCLIHGNNLAAAFPVKINTDKTIGELKKIIKDENSNEFAIVDAKDLMLWKVEIPDDNEDEKIRFLLQYKFEIKTELLGTRYIEDYWTDSPPKRCIHVIVKSPPAVIGHGSLVTNQSTSAVENITRELEKFNLDYPVGTQTSLSSNFSPEFLKIIKEKSEIIKQIMEHEKGSMTAEAEVKIHEDIVFAFNPENLIGGPKSYLIELSKTVNDHLLKYPLVEKTEITVQTWFNELTNALSSRQNNELVVKDKDTNNDSYLNRFMPDFRITKEDGTISLRINCFMKIEYRFKIYPC
ncbi:hypothetical protein C1645_866758 [Glomus cerebriforme]|uniref:Uncharacterized protein n=1 Tax=Glomus cerebriforme TaxID=658196 RepID=A0A397T904_9GLOM|nr:hypothetical protein C1645_866758 [Glomus cerebriforme]